ncbi:MAG: PAS domain-containing protein [Acidimicrobiales bacterium]|nr:PAS domain-containing protein [Acidimicrobiales bacterium]
MSQRELLDRLPDGILLLDSSRCITGVNSAMLALTGFGENELVGRSCDGLIDWHDSSGREPAGGAWPAPTRLRGTKAITPQLVLVHRAGADPVPMTVTGTYDRDSGGHLSGAVLSLRPPPRGRPRVPGGIEIVSTVSHELRSPLTSVKGYTSLMLNRWERLTDEQKKMMLGQVNHDADRVTRLITELLDISRLETGRLTLRRQMIEVPRLAACVVEKVALEYPQLEARTVFPPSFPKVYADPDKIEQVLTNLVENACKYASPRGLVIDGTVEHDAVTVRVHDQGEGIPASDIPKVFTKFFRRASGRPTGSGLGLWISRGLVESHGGELQAESNVGKGSTFRFTLPLLDLDRLQES